MDKVKYVFVIVLGALAAYFQQYIILYALVGVACLLDLITGVCASVVDGSGLSSDVARKGVLKKIVLLLAVALGTYLDFLVHFATEKAGISFDALVFSATICVYICVTECISIIENIYRATGGAIPKWIMNMLKQHKDNLEKGGSGSGKTDKQ